MMGDRGDRRGLLVDEYVSLTGLCWFELLSHHHCHQQQHITIFIHKSSSFVVPGFFLLVSVYLRLAGQFIHFIGEELYSCSMKWIS
jgi:hypothetical protein